MSTRREKVRRDVERHLATDVGKDDALAQREADRIATLKVNVRRRMLVMEIWCESGRCSIGRVYRTRRRLLFVLHNEEGEMPERMWNEAQRQRGNGWNGGPLKRGGYWLDATLLPRRYTCSCINTVARSLDMHHVLGDC